MDHTVGEAMEDDEDSHLCLKCNMTIHGLENYVQHRRNKCGGAAAFPQFATSPRSSEDRPARADNPYSPSKALDFFSSLNLRSTRLDDWDFDIQRLGELPGSNSKHFRFPEIESNFEPIVDLMKNRGSLDLETDNLNDSSLLNLEPSKSTRSILDSDIFSTGHFDNPTTGEHHHSPLDLTTRNGLRPIMGGKWLPEKPGSTKRPQSYFFCRVCNRSLASSLLYDRHLQSELHFKRLTESSVFDMDDDIAPLPPRVRGQRYSEESNLSPKRPRRTIKGTHTTRKAMSQRVRHGRGGRYLFCAVCSTRVPKRLMGKHLLSYYHNTYIPQQPQLSESLVLQYFHLIVKESPFKCTLCSFYCNTSDNLLLHFRSDMHHTMDKLRPGVYWCHQCKVEAPTTEDMEDHLRSTEHTLVAITLNHSVPIEVRKRCVFTCSECDATFNLKIQLVQHLRRSHHLNTAPEPVFSCHLCGYSCNKQSSLQRHQLSTHGAGTISQYYCSACDLQFPNLEASNEHRRTVECRVQRGRVLGRDVRRRCNLCGEECDDLARLKDHIFLHHAGALFRCKLCNQSFAISQDLSRHVRDNKCTGPSLASIQLPTNIIDDEPEETFKSRKNRFACDICHRNFTRRSNLTVHCKTSRLHLKRLQQMNIPTENLETLREEDRNERPVKGKPPKRFVCDICSYRAPKKCFIERHICSIHFQETRKRDSICDICSKAFYDKYAMRQHRKLHFPKQFQCEDEGCNFKSRYPSEVRRHHKTVHEPKEHIPEPFPCMECIYIAKSEILLKRHMTKHKERAYPCPHCEFSFSVNSHLRRHLRVHTGHKPFKCPHCEFQCNSLENLRKHILVTKKHEGLEVYRCKLCSGDVAFSSNSANAFRSHLRTEHAKDEEVAKLGTRNILLYVRGICENFLELAKTENYQVLRRQTKSKRKAKPKISPAEAVRSQAISFVTIETELKPRREWEQYEAPLSSNIKIQNRIITDSEDISDLLRPKLDIPVEISNNSTDCTMPIFTVSVGDGQMGSMWSTSFNKGSLNVPLVETGPEKQLILLQNAGNSACVVVNEAVAAATVEFVTPPHNPLRSLLALQDENFATYESILDGTATDCNQTLRLGYQDDMDMKVVVNRVEDEYLLPNSSQGFHAPDLLS